MFQNSRHTYRDPRSALTPSERLRLMFHRDEEAKAGEPTQDAKLKHPLLSKNQSGVKKRPSGLE